MIKLKNLFSPIMIGNVEIRNRIELAPVTDNYGVDDLVTERMKAFYEERAMGGAGLINVGFFTVNYPPNPLGVGMYDDKCIPGLRELAEVCHEHGAKIGVELNFEEYYANKKGGPFELVGPSAVAVRKGKPVPRELTIEEIEQVVSQYGDAARRAREGGIDICHLIAHAGYPLSQFFSPLTNKRTDKYGGSFENRTRIIVEIIESIKKKAGNDYTITCRIGGQDFVPGGSTYEDNIKLAKLLESVGVAMLNVTTGWHDANVPFIPYYVPKGNWIYMAERVKQNVNIPVVTGTRILDPVLADKIIGEGKADLVYFARSLIADAYFPKKAMEGRFDEIVPCTSCCHCFDRWAETKPVTCQVNARAGYELVRSIVRTNIPKKVFVIGGGPSGMEAARVAALRGHQVTLFEKDKELGGALRAASAAPFKDGYEDLRQYLIKAIEKAGVEVKSSTEVDAEMVMAAKPDEVIIATGGVAVVPAIPGAEGNNVVTAVDLLINKLEVGKKVVVIGGGMVGCEAADYLHDQGREVVLVEMLGKIAVDVGRTLKWVVRQRMNSLGIKIVTSARAQEITDKGVQVLSGGSTHFYEADSVVLAVGTKGNNKLAGELAGKVKSMHKIGDCVESAKVAEAIESGFLVGSEI